MPLIELDNVITFAVYNWGVGSPLLQYALYVLASLFIYLLPLVLIWMYFRSYVDRVKAFKIGLAAMLAWQVFTNLVGSWLYGTYAFRPRPFVSQGLSEYFFEQPDKAFPSDHAAVMMVVALAFFGYKYPGLGWLFLIGGLLSSFGRIAVGFHYLGDIFGGFLLGVLAYFIIRGLDRYLDGWLNPIARKLPPKTHE